MKISYIPDEYDVRARILPALFVLLPCVVNFVVWYPELLNTGNLIYSIVVTSGGLACLAMICRNEGKKVQSELFSTNAGIVLPTTSMLRHCDTTVDAVTKRRYHDVLQSNLPSLSLPSTQEELEDKCRADLLYNSAVMWLKEYARDKKKYPLVFQENVNYGFSRNLFGVKRYGIILSIAMVVGNILMIYTRYQFKISLVPPQYWLVSAISIIMLFIWINFINANWVKLSAQAYGKALLATCEKVSNPKQKNVKRLG